MTGPEKSWRAKNSNNRPGKKAPASDLPTPARLRVANPRQGDYAKPDCRRLGERPAARHQINNSAFRSFLHYPLSVAWIAEYV